MSGLWQKDGVGMRLRDIKKGMRVQENDYGFCAEYIAQEDARHLDLPNIHNSSGWECKVQWVGGDTPTSLDADDCMVFFQADQSGGYSVKLELV